ncbi:polysaccharide lyase family 8 super-sandwich domain-containing protein [Microbacterium sp. PA5]|uniref:polysaccharide lyase family 8 super-sandwich domain-containing protein n=1 Tax=Microbacterium sp. PA5 TaxID=3416654 RepID=UPI003CF61D11
MNRVRSLLALALVLVLSVAGIVAGPAPAATADDDVDTVIARLQEYYLSQGDEIIIANGIYLARASEALEYVESQNADGSWSDVDYADRTSSANGATWSAYIALYRMLALAHAYRDPGAAGYDDPTVLLAIERALLHWDRVNPGNSNWWETEIGESIAMGRLSLLLRDVLSEEAFAVALTHNTGKLDPAGANGAWRTTNYLFEAFATGNTQNIAAGFATMVATIAVDRSGAVNEAVQPDASFWAHGAQLYSEGYGMVLLTSAALWADVARGTSLAFTREQLDSIAFYAIDGTRWMIRGEIGMLYLNYRAPKTIQGVTSHASEFIEAYQRMARTDPLYSTAYQAVLDGVLGKTRTNGATGDKYFWRSEFSSHLRDEYGIFIRLNSSRTFGAELRTAYDDAIGNPVYWNAMGSTAIQVDNREYLDLGPTFDWYHYPGVTAPYVKRTERGVENRGRNGDGGSFTGGVSNGRYGLSVLTLDTAGTTGQKSYFTFDDEMVALGTDIRSTSASPVHTTINQAVAEANAAVGGATVAAGTDAQSAGDARWAYNDEIGYVFAAGQDVKVSNKAQTGSWPGAEPVTRDAFSLFIDHGTTPSDGSYDYTVLPAAEPADVEAYAADPDVITLRNDTAVQAVRHAGLDVTMATFAAAGSLDLGGGRSLTVDQPSLVLLDESGEQPMVSVANPDRPGLTVRVSLADGDRSASGVFALGAGANLGKTVTAALVAGELPDDSAYSASSSAPGADVAALGDGDRDTLWTSDGHPVAWVDTRLARGSWVTGVTIDWADEFATDFVVQTSRDGVDWIDHAHIVDGSGGVTEVPITPTAAGHVRLVMRDGGGDRYGIRELTVTSGVNLAADAATRASGYAGYNLVYLMTDGDPNTRWRGNNANSAWAQVDLGSSRPLGAVRLRWEAAYAKTYKIQLSDDGASWRDAYTTPTGGSDGDIDVITIEGQSARFVRMQTLTRALDYGPSLWEFEVFSDRTVVDAPKVPTNKGNLALNRPTTADSVYNNNATIVASKATDGAGSTKWSSARAATEHWLQVDLGATLSVSRAIVKWESGTSNNYRIEGSADGTTWTTLTSVTSAQPSLQHTLDFSTAHVRYVKLTGLPATQYGLNIWEFELYGGSALECVSALTADADGSATVSATIQPAEDGDVIRAVSLDDSVARVVGDGRAAGSGRTDFEIATGAPGATDILLTHAAGNETAWCHVIVTADLDGLTSQLDRSAALESATYTADSWKPVIPARDRARAIRGEVGATQAEVDAATAALRSAIDELEVSAVDPVPTVTVSRTEGLDPDGETIVVTGSGFTARGTDTAATEGPLAGSFGGVAVVFGRFSDDWRPSQGGSGRHVIDEKWAVHAEDLAAIGGEEAGGVVVDENGGFRVELAVASGRFEEDGEYGVYTFAGGGAVFAPFETATPVTLAEEAAAITAQPADVTATVTAAAPTSTVTFTVGATGAPTPTITWQERRPGSDTWADIAGETGATVTRTVRAADDGGAVRAVVANGLATVTSDVASITVQTAPAELMSSVPTISGTAKVGVKLTASAGSWTPGADLSYQWLRSGTAISGATSSSYTPVAADYGKSLSVRVTGTLAGYTTVSRTSAAKTVAAGTLTSAVPTISGAARVGVKLTAKPGTWTAGTSLTYQWLVGGKAVKGATSSTYTPRAADLGRSVQVSVTGSKAGYTSVVKTSAAKKVAAGKLTSSKPRITGTPAVGKKLTAVTGTWTAGTKVTYRWYVSGKAVKGATSSTYTVRSADRGKSVVVKTTGVKAGYASVTTSSTPKKIAR